MDLLVVCSDSLRNNGHNFTVLRLKPKPKHTRSQQNTENKNHSYPILTIVFYNLRSCIKGPSFPFQALDHNISFRFSSSKKASCNILNTYVSHDILCLAPWKDKSFLTLRHLQEFNKTTRNSAAELQFITAFKPVQHHLIIRSFE